MCGRLKHILSRLLAMPLITTLLRPGLRGFPVLLEFRIPPAAFAKPVSKTGNLRQRPQVMRVTLERLLLVRKFMPRRLLRNARLQGALHSVPRQIVCASHKPNPSKAFASFSLTFDSACRSLRSTNLHHIAAPRRSPQNSPCYDSFLSGLGLRATDGCKPRQVRKEATVVVRFVCRGLPGAWHMPAPCIR